MAENRDEQSVVKSQNVIPVWPAIWTEFYFGPSIDWVWAA